MPTVEFTYDGGSGPGEQDGTVVATIDDAVVGQTYRLDDWSQHGSGDGATATDTTLVLTSVGVGGHLGSSGESFLEAVYNDDTGEPVGATTFSDGVASTGEQAAGLSATWDGDGTFTLSYPAQGWGIWVGQVYGNNSSEDDSGAAGTLTVENVLDPANSGNAAGDIIDVEVEGDPGASQWWHDIAAYWVFPGDTTVYSIEGGAVGLVSARFTGAPRSGAAPLEVAFTDSSIPGASGPITDWAWDFGDGGSSSEQNPTHTYVSPGTYTVSLTVTGTSPDGSSTKTKAGYIVVGAAPPNTDCSTAVDLTPASNGSMIVDNTYAPDTPLADDPLNKPWPDGYNEGNQFSRQLWFKLTNDTGARKFCRFLVTTVGWTVGAVYLGSCPALEAVGGEFGTEWKYLQPQFFVSEEFAPPFGEFNEVLWSFLAGGETSAALGILLDAGQTIWLELAADDTESGPGWKGPLSLVWDLHSVTMYDDIDVRRPPPDGDGESDVVPTHTSLDTSGFDLAPISGGSANVFQPCAYAFFGGHHFICTYCSTDKNAPPGSDGGGASWAQDQIGIWELDVDGTQLNFWIIFQGTHTTSLSLVNAQAGEGVDTFGGKWFKFCSDSETLWLLTPLFRLTANPYDSTHHTWAPARANVFAHTLSDSGWTDLGGVEARTSNDIFFMNLTGGYSGFVYNMDACASPDQPGVLHVILSEWGVQDGPDGVHSGFATHGDYGTSPRRIRWSTAYGSFSSSAKLSDVTLASADIAAGTDPIGTHSAASEQCWIRNDGGTPVFAWVPGNDDIVEHPVYTDHLDLYLAPDMSLISTIAASDLSEFISGTNAYNGNPNWPTAWASTPPDELLECLWSSSAEEDVGNDGRRVWYVALGLHVAGTSGTGNKQVWCLLRIPPDYPPEWTYFESDQQWANFQPNNLVPSFDLYPEPKHTWTLPVINDQGTFWAYIRCVNDNGWGMKHWGNFRFAHSDIGSASYPSTLKDGYGSALIGDDFWYAGRYLIDYTTGVYGLALAKTHILRDALICTLDETVGAGLHVWDRV